MLGHDNEEAAYFLLLVQHDRAGSLSLKTRWKDQITAAREKRLVLKDRVDIKATLSLADQAIYYGAWYYAAVHILVTMRSCQNVDAIVEYLRLPVKKVTEVLEFLTSVGLVQTSGDQIKPGLSRIFLGSDSPMIARHHSNWRLRAIDSLDRDPKEDLHFSTVVSVTREDSLRIKEFLVKSIETARGIVARSQNETDLQCLCVDFFKV
jgi:uncharacterized protein (TIGR02147 family)